MFLAVGASDIVAGMFHLLSHAFFKSLLFLAAGCVIKALAEEHNIYQDGQPAPPDAQRGHPVPHRRAVSERLPPAGRLLQQGPHPAVHIRDSRAISYKLFWGAGFLAALLTPLYTFRLYFIAFGSRDNGRTGRAQVKQTCHAFSPGCCGRWPPWPLATDCSTCPWGRASIGWPSFMASSARSPHGGGRLPGHRGGHGPGQRGRGAGGHRPGNAWLYRGVLIEPNRAASVWRDTLFHAFYLDRLYELALVRPYRATADFLWKQFDDNGLDLGFTDPGTGTEHIFTEAWPDGAGGRLVPVSAHDSCLALVSWCW